MARISLITPTQRRPEGLARAGRSLFAQAGVEVADLEWVVVDNDQKPSAQGVVEALRKDAPFPVIYVYEPQAGVANARNAAMAAATGELIIFLDDDEEAPAAWVATLLAAQARYEADVVFGPVRGRAPSSIKTHRAYLERFFSREGPAEAGLIDYYYGCGDSLLRRAALPHSTSPFSPARNHIGGEDDLLFGGMQKAGARFAWEPAAWVWEDPAPERLTLAYTLRRAFAYGQGPSSHCAAASPPDRMGVARWMVVGVGQAVVYGAVAALQWLTRRPDRAETLDRAARGLGKTLWWGPFKIHFYGQTA